MGMLLLENNEQDCGKSAIIAQLLIYIQAHYYFVKSTKYVSSCYHLATINQSFFSYSYCLFLSFEVKKKMQLI